MDEKLTCNNCIYCHHYMDAYNIPSGQCDITDDEVDLDDGYCENHELKTWIFYENIRLARTQDDD